jgi:hypothetical protein
MFVRDITVVTRCCELRRAPLGTVLVVWAQVDVVEFDCVFDMGADGLCRRYSLAV